MRSTGNSGHCLKLQPDGKTVYFNSSEVDAPVRDTATWTFTNLQPGTYKVFGDWLTILDIHPAKNAEYKIYDGDSQTPIAIVHIDQRYFPDDLVMGLDAWENLGTVTITGSTLKVVLSGANADGDVIAGRVRIEPVGDPGGARIVSNHDSGYSEAPAVMYTCNTSTAIADISLLQSGKMPQSLLDLLTANGESPSLFVQYDFTVQSTFFQTIIRLVDKLRTKQVGSLSEFLYQQFSEKAKLVIDDDTSNNDQLRTVLVQELNRLLRGKSIYSEQFFNGVSLSAETSTLLAQDPQQGERLIRLNRLLLEDYYRAEIARSLSKGFAVSVLENGTKWLVTNIEKIDPLKSDRIRYTEKYLIVKENDTFKVSMVWDELKYPMGSGNFTLWESDLLRPAFRELFIDWQNGAQQFPDLGDAATRDPNHDHPLAQLITGVFPDYEPETPSLHAPVVNTPTVNNFSNGNLVVSGDLRLTYSNDLVIQNITGDGDGAADTLTLIVRDSVKDPAVEKPAWPFSFKPASFSHGSLEFCLSYLVIG